MDLEDDRRLSMRQNGSERHGPKIGRIFRRAIDRLLPREENEV
jgi:hypothetical protein